MAEELVERTVIWDLYAWMTPAEGIRDRLQHNVATRGETISVSPAEARRGEELGALGTEEQAILADAAAQEPGVQPDEVVRGMTAPELVAYVGQHPTEAEHLRELEEERPEGKQRSTVLDAIDRVIDERDAELEARLQAAGAAG